MSQGFVNPQLATQLGSATFWVKFHWTGSAIVIDNSYNVSGVTRTSAGLYVVTYASTMIDVNTVIVSMAETSANAWCSNIQAQSTTNCTVLMTQLGVGSVDPDSCHVVGFGT